MARRKVAILISGRGSNMAALIDAARDTNYPAEIALVLSNRADAPGIDRAREAGIATAVVSSSSYPSREAFDAALDAELKGAGIDLVCLAGFMRLLSPVFVRAFPGRVLNIHPSLLPAFPGLEAQRLAFEHGVKVTGATVHLVDEGLDSGPIVAQEAVPVRWDDTVESLSVRILEAEHRLYPRAVRLLLESRCRVEGRRIIVEEA
jgi:phosphoribosylglycinamide formyltransferase-1